MTDLKQLVSRRGVIKGQLTSFGKYLEALESDSSKIDELQCRLEKLEEFWREFNDIQLKIEFIDNSPGQLEERSIFEDKYYSNLAKGRKHITNSTKKPIIVSDVQDNTVNIQQRVVLPKLNLPEFSGAYDQWYSYHDTFMAIIHNNSTLCNIQKFQYLRASLKGEAAQVIQSLEVSEVNYATAWELLKVRFENKKVIVKTHLKAIFELPTVTSSASSIRQFTDNFLKHFRALENLKVAVTSWDTVLIYLLTSKLDSGSKKEWEVKTNDNDFPTITEFTTFLANRSRLLESLDNKQGGIVKRVEMRTQAYASTSSLCPYCKESHHIYYCKRFLELSCADRLGEVKKLNLCINCLRRGHNSNACQSRRCKTCNKKHNSLLHFDERANISVSSAPGKQTVETTVASCCSQVSDTIALLSTAVVNILDAKSQPVKIRCLLDNGSQSNFITYDLVKRLGLQSVRINMPVVGINSVVTSITQQASATIKALQNRYTKDLNFLVIEKITENIPQFNVSTTSLDIPADINLADPQFSEPARVDALLGVGIFYELLRSGQIKLGKGKPILQNSVFGWIVSGPMMASACHSAVCNFSTNLDIHNQIEKFWLVEQGRDIKFYTKEEQECENTFASTFKRDSLTGRFSVQLPLRDNHMSLGESLYIAEKRFYSIEQKLSKDTTLKTQYCQFMEEYENLGHMSKVNPQKATPFMPYYLPHHCVTNGSSLTTKLRVVFDGSCKSTSGKSLNDILKVGPSIQDELFAILLRMRKHNIIIIADIEKMYRQIQLIPEHREFQRILWRSDPSKPLEHFTLNTVTYGTAAASFLSTRCLKQVAIDNLLEYPEASQIILQDFYVDDLITGCSDVRSAKSLIHDLNLILSRACFPLRKWSSNDHRVLADISKTAQDMYTISNEQSHKTLGVSWNTKDDTFQYATAPHVKSDKITKRQILSKIAQVFDPLGLLGPIIVKAKLIMQQLWLSKLEWDDIVPSPLLEKWSEFIYQLREINKYSIPRQVVISNFKVLEIHAFSDASEVAYGSCIYLKSISHSGSILVRLLTAKSRIAPIKALSIPRLELCGAVLMAKLVRKVSESLKMEVQKTHYYTDSTIVLAWLKLEPSRLNQFVAHRVAEIQELSHETQWNHVSSADNPADVISRGTDPGQLLEQSIWWNGPAWLASPVAIPDNSATTESLSEVNIPELRTKSLSHTCSAVIKSDIFSRFSSYTSLQRVTAYCLKFIAKLRHHCTLSNELTISDLDQATLRLVKLVQGECFASEIHDLQRMKHVSRNSKLASLDPFCDDDGVLRVGGRLKHSPLPYQQRHQMILPSNHNFTTLLIEYEHKRNLHSGVQTTLSSIRLKYWPINGKQTIRGILRRCVKCFRINPSTLNQKMGDLPPSRITPTRPFSICGVDYAGPFLVKDGKLRNRKCVKAYLCVFICFVSKAVHLEITTDLSAAGFLNVLRRFVSRRGLCAEIFSDNAPNFRGANAELRRFSQMSRQDVVNNYMNENSIKWSFIPPRSPHHGGLWESAVKTAKYYLKRVSENAKLTYEEFSTLLCQIEAIMNSRPLSPLSSDPSDLEPLTPGHFLIGCALNTIPQPICDIQGTPLSRYEHIQKLSQHFWKRWSRDYLHNMQQRNKWRFQKDLPQLTGALVLLKDDQLPPQRWSLGRVTAVHPGADGIVRVVTVRTVSGSFKRAITKICVLPIDE